MNNKRLINYFMLFILLFSITLPVLAKMKIKEPGFEYFYNDLKFEEIFFFNRKLKIELPVNATKKRTKFLTRCDFALAMPPLYKHTMGRVAHSAIYLNISHPYYSNNGAYFNKRVSEKKEKYTADNHDSSIKLLLILTDSNNKQVEIRVVGGDDYRKKEETYYEKRLSENRKIFDHIKNSLRIQNEKGEYLKPEIIKLKDKIYDKTEAARKAKHSLTMKDRRDIRKALKESGSKKDVTQAWREAERQNYEKYLKSLGYDLDKIEYVM